MVYETILRSDLKEGVKVVQLKGNMFTMDSKANKIIVEVYSAGVPVTLDQTKGITAYMVRNDKKTIVVGTAGTEEYVAYESTNSVSLTLPPNAYGKEGQLSIVIKHNSVTVGACTVYVYKTSTDTWIDPEGEIPSIEELEEMLSEYAATNAAAQKVANMTVTAEAASGSTPSVEKTMVGSGDQEHVNLNFKLVKGDTGNTGATGATPQLSVGTVTDVPYGTGASVTITGTAEAPVLNFSLQAGQSGNETIDDTAGLGDTDLVWSADKTDKEVIRLDGIKANTDSTFTYKETYGSVVEFDDGVSEAVKQMRIDIAPLQDLHGYDAPWVGGAGINIMKYPYYDSNSSYTRNGVTFTISSDGIITITTGSGSASADTYFNLHHESEQVVLAQDTYIISTDVALPTGVSLVNNIHVGSSNINGGNINAGGSSTYWTVSNTGYFRSYVQIASGTSISSLVIKPMLRLATYTDVTWQPYINICPISGWAGAEVTVRKKNLLPKFGSEWVTGTTETYFGAKTSDSTPTFPFNFLNTGASSYTNVPVYVFKCKPNTTYTIKPPQNLKPIVSEYASYEGITNKANALNRWTDNTTGFSVAITKTTQANAQYLVISFSDYSNVPGGVVVDKNTQFQLEEGSTATTFEAFAKHYNISFPSSAGTVYGGTLTVNQDGTGTLVVNKAIVALSGLTTSDIDYSSSTKTFYAKSSSVNWTPGMKCKASTEAFNGSSNKFKAYMGNTIPWASLTECCVGYISDSRESVRFSIPFKTTVDQEVVSILNGTEVCYELANTSTYTLTTDQVVHLLSGQNTVYADCGDITLLYPTDKYLTTEQAERERIHESIAVSAPVQTINDGADNVPMDVSVAIEPVQDLHGYDNPWVGGAGKNISPITVESIKSASSDLTWNGNSATSNGITFTILTDSDGNVTGINVNGTATATAVLTMYNKATCPFAEGSYKINGLWANGSGSTFKHDLIYLPTPTSSNTTLAVDLTAVTGSDVVVTQAVTEGVNFKERLVIYSGQVLTNVKLYPMIRLATDTDATFAPYQNICPISGWDKAEVTRTGKNLFDYNTCENKSINESGTISNANNRLLSSIFSVKKGQTYTVSYPTGIKFIGHVEYSDSDMFVGRVFVDQSTGDTEIIPSVNRIRLYFSKTTSSAEISKSEIATAQLEVGTTKTNFESFASNTYTIPFNTDCYGGYFTVGKDGEVELTVTHALLEKAVSAMNNSDNYPGWSGAGIASIIGTGKEQGLRDYVSNVVKDVSTDPAKIACNTKNSNDVLYLPKAQWNNLTQTQFKSTYPDLVMQFVFPLATPVTTRLNPCTIRSLLGTNNIWSNTGNVLQLNYSCDLKTYIDQLFASLTPAEGSDF